MATIKTIKVPTKLLKEIASELNRLISREGNEGCAEIDEQADSATPEEELTPHEPTTPPVENKAWAFERISPELRTELKKMSEWRRNLRSKRKGLETLSRNVQQMMTDLVGEELEWEAEADRLADRLREEQE
jgi:hypothetical protein